MRNSDENTTFTDEGPWERVAQMAQDTFRKLSTGASWSGHERNHLFMGGLEGHQFLRVSGLSGLDDPGDSRAFATLDFDRDGWLDVALGNVSAPRLRLLRNELGDRPGQAQHAFVAVRLRGGNTTPRPSEEWSSRDGLGARVVVELTGGRRVHREHRVDDGFKAQNSGTMLIGLGAAESIARVFVTWPSGREQVAEGVTPGSLLTFFEDASASPNGRAFTSEPYRRAPGAVAEASAPRTSSWPARMFPAEPSGQTLELKSADAGDAALVLHVAMATWCANCAQEIPELRAIDAAFEDSELAMIGVPCDPEDTAEGLVEWAQRLDPPYVIANISGAERESVLDVAEALLHEREALPFSIVTDAEGEVLLATWGAPSISELRRLLWLGGARVER